MSKKVLFRSQSFYVTSPPPLKREGKSCAQPWFRISRLCSNAVKRNKVKRIIREFINKNSGIFPERIIFHIHKQHLHLHSDWKKYIEGVYYDLAKFAKHQKRYRYVKREINATGHITLSA